MAVAFEKKSHFLRETRREIANTAQYQNVRHDVILHTLHTDKILVLNTFTQGGFLDCSFM